MNENLKEVTACPYIKDKTRWHCDMSYVDPHTSKEVRLRRVAPADRKTLEDALKWGEGERMRLYMKACRATLAASEDREEEENTVKTNTKAKKLADVWPDFEAAHICKQKIATRTSYAHASRYILATLGDLRLDQVDGPALERLRDALKGAGLEVSSQKIYMAKMAKALRWAMRRGMIPRAILPSVEFDAERKRRIDIYSPEDLERALAVAGDLYERVLMLLLADAALRIGECAGLQWADIDPSKGRHGAMKICRNVCQGHLQDTTKSGEDGEVPLSPRLADALRELRARGQHPIWVLPRRAGVRKARSARPRPRAEHSSEAGLARIVVRLEREAGLVGHGPHRIRHSRLTHLAERGVPLRALQHLARHARETTTEKYYIHVNKLRMAESAIDELVLMTPPPGNGGETDGNRAQITLVA